MKYCPLCGAEYRDEFDRCKGCEASLVASLDAEEVRANPPRLLWKGRDQVEFDVVSAALFDAGVPARIERALGGLVGSITHRESTIHLLAADFDRGLDVAATFIMNQASFASDAEICYNCAASCSPSLAVCPKCRAQLIVEPLKGAETVSAQAAPAALKY